MVKGRTLSASVWSVPVPCQALRLGEQALTAAQTTHGQLAVAVAQVVTVVRPLRQALYEASDYSQMPQMWAHSVLAVAEAVAVAVQLALPVPGLALSREVNLGVQTLEGCLLMAC